MLVASPHVWISIHDELLVFLVFVLLHGIFIRRLVSFEDYLHFIELLQSVVGVDWEAQVWQQLVAIRPLGRLARILSRRALPIAMPLVTLP